MQGEIDKLIRSYYYTCAKHQEKLCDEVLNHLQEEIQKLIVSVDKSTAKSNQLVKRVEVVNEKLSKVKKWWDLIWYAAPALVAVDVIIKVVQLVVK